MNNFRMCDILNALTDMKLTYPASYDSIIPHLKSMIEEDERDLWVCRVVNTDPTGQPGHHYNHVVYGINSEGVPWATYLEPLADLSISIHMSETLRKEVPKVQIEHIPVKVQDDGHSCGYISVWWQIHCQLLVNTGSVPLNFEPPTPPQGWERVCLRLFTIFDMQNELDTEHVRDIGLRPLFKKALRTGIFDEGAFLTQINEYGSQLQVHICIQLLSFHFPVPCFLFSHKIVSFNVCQSKVTTSFVLYLEVECLGMFGN